VVVQTVGDFTGALVGVVYVVLDVDFVAVVGVVVAPDVETDDESLASTSSL
jgi:hypothetical protein